MNALSIGIDIGGSRLKAAIVAADGSLSHQIIEASRIAEPYPAVLHQLIDVVHRLRLLTTKPMESLGIGVAGLVSLDRRTILAAPNCPGVVNTSLCDDLERATGIACLMDNDANVMALGEGFAGAAKGCRHFAAVTLGTGIGGAVVINGELLRGFTGGGAELGHVCIERNGPRCGCGSRGCLEAFIGLKGIFRFTARRFPRLRGLGAAKLAELAMAGDQEASTVFRYIGETLAIGLAGTINIFNPEIVIVGGGVACAGEVLFEPLRQEVARRAFPVYLEGLKIEPAQLGNWAGVVGAALLNRG